tara:strand:- start:219 stop:563 length:345 start_codon:yes stop_codon:yes gene_type:complete
MDGAVDIKFLVTLGGIIFSVAGAAAVGKMQIKTIIESLGDVEKRLRDIDKRLDVLETNQGIVQNQINTLKSILSPDNLAKQNRELEGIKVSVVEAHKDIDRLFKMHNGSHPEVN